MKTTCNQNVHSYAVYFSESLCRCIPKVPCHIEKRLAAGDTHGERSRKRRKCAFIESDITRYVRATVSKSWPRIVVEQKDGKSGNVDYHWELSANVTAATCEFKGPARPKTLNNTENNWFWEIVADVAKNIYRCHTNGDQIQRHNAVVFYGSTEEVGPKFERSCMKPLRVIFPRARFGQRHCSDLIVKGEHMSLIVFSVGVEP